MIPVNHVKTLGRTEGPKEGGGGGGGDPKFGTLTITSERSGRVANMEETWVVPLVTRGEGGGGGGGVTGFRPKTQCAC